MKIFLPAAVSVCFFLCTISYDARASHSMGADLSYECLGGDSFRIRLNFYRDCGGIIPSTTASVDIVSASCNMSLLSRTLTLAPAMPGADNPRELPKLCPAQASLSTCETGTIPGVEVWTYEAVVTLPAHCADWMVSYSLCCRNDSSSNPGFGLSYNLLTAGSYELYVEALLNNAGGLCNNSPFFTSDPVPYRCLDNTFYNHGAVDSDGDSLVFSLVNPLSAGAPIPYADASFSPTNPFNTVNGFIFNPVTGQMEFEAAGGQSAVVAVLVEEYRNGVLIGSTMRDIQIVMFATVDCSQPQITGIRNLTGGVMIDSVTLQVCPQEFISFEFNLLDTVVSHTLTYSSNITQSIPDASLTFNGSGNAFTGFFSWMPTGADTGANVFTVTVLNDACPTRGEVQFAFQIFVLRGTDAGPDLTYCPAGGPVLMNAFGGNTFSWRPSGGLSATNVRTPLASPATDTEYIVTSDLSGLCKNTDSVWVRVVPDFVLQITPDDSICLHSSTTLSVTTDAQWAPYTYNWSPTISLVAPTAASTGAFPVESTTYHVVVTSDTGCTIRDSVNVTIVGVGPLVEVSADRNNVCPGDSVQLQAIIYPLACGPTVHDCSAQNLPVPKSFANAGAAVNFRTPFAGSNPDARYQALYLASDLLAAGITTGTITRIDFIDSAKASTAPYQGLTIKLGCTDATSLSTSRGWEPVSTVVYGPTIYFTSLGVNSFPLSTPFDWDGLSNLVIEICYNNPDTLGPRGDDQLMCVQRNYTASMRGVSSTNDADGCILNPTFSYAYIPTTIFTICDPLLSGYTYTWTPGTGLSDPSVIDPKAALTGPVTYTLVAGDSLCDGSGFINLDIDNSYGIKATPDTTICGSNPVQLNAVELGSPPLSTLPCGINGTQCFGTSITRQIGFSSASTTTTTPYRGFWHDGRVQILYRAADLNVVGISGSGTISEIAYSILFKRSTIPYNGFTIKMSCTTLNSLPSSFVSGISNVVYGPVIYNTALGWNTHVLNNPYDWDGVSNIIVEICFDNSSYTQYDEVNYTTTVGNTVLYDHQDSDVGCTLNFPTASTLRPNTRFKFCAAPPGTTSAVWSPALYLDDPNIFNPVATPPVTTTYTVEYTFINGCTRVDSCTVNVVVFNAVADADTGICKGESVQLSVAGGDLVYWDSVPGLNCYTCRNPIATPDTSSTYIVTVTDLTGNCISRDTVNITVFEPPPIKFYNDSLYCFVASLELDAGAGFAAYSWSTGATTRQIVLTSPGDYAVTVTDSSGCVQSDAIRLDNNTPPTISLGSNQTTCYGSALTFDAGPGFTAYAWNTSSTDQTLTVFVTGDYSVTVTDVNNCPAIDTVRAIFSTPDVDFGPDTTLCAGVVKELVAGYSYNHYIWSDGTSDTFIIVTQPGIYWVSATDTIGCIDEDTLVLDYYPDNSVDIGPDDTTCNNRTVMFNANLDYDYVAYAWSNGEVSPTITVSTGDNYVVTVTDSNNCLYTDSAVLIDETPIVFIGNDTAICVGQTATFSAFNANFTAYLWNTGSDASQITVSTSDTYSVIVTQGATCTATDEVKLTVNELPQPDLGVSDSVCPEYFLFPGLFETYLWNDGTTNQVLIVTESGSYDVTVTDKNGCENFDSVDIYVYEIVLSIDDVLLCERGDSSVLRAPSTGINSYHWSTGSPDSNIVVKEAGTYSVTVVYAQNCTVSDQSTVSFDSLEVTAAANPVFIGVSDSSLLTANVINGTGNYQFNWTPVESLDTPNDPTTLARPQANTTYTVVATDLETGCMDTTTVEVIVDSRFTMPEAFTPNGDGSNDVFHVIPTGYIEVQEFRIYNRWGQQISADITGWDGNYNGKEQPIGTYTYYTVVKLANNEIKTQSGAFSLVR